MQYTGFSGRPCRFTRSARAPADEIIQQLEGHGIADGEIVERGAVLEVAPMEIDLACVCETVAMRRSRTMTTPLDFSIV